MAGPVHARRVAVSDPRLDPAEGPAFEVVDPEGEEAVALVGAYVAELEQRFHGPVHLGGVETWGLATHRPPRGRFLVARTGGEAVACGGVRTLEPGVGEIKRMYVAPAARGTGLGRRLLVALEDACRDLGHTRVRLDTNSALGEAIGLYARAGYVQIPAYHDGPGPDLWFEKALTS